MMAADPPSATAHPHLRLVWEEYAVGFCGRTAGVVSVGVEELKLALHVMRDGSGSWLLLLRRRQGVELVVPRGRLSIRHGEL